MYRRDIKWKLFFNCIFSFIMKMHTHKMIPGISWHFSYSVPALKVLVSLQIPSIMSQSFFVLLGIRLLFLPSFRYICWNIYTWNKACFKCFISSFAHGIKFAWIFGSFWSCSTVCFGGRGSLQGCITMVHLVVLWGHSWFWASGCAEPDVFHSHMVQGDQTLAPLPQCKACTMFSLQSSWSFWNVLEVLNLMSSLWWGSNFWRQLLQNNIFHSSFDSKSQSNFCNEFDKC